MGIPSGARANVRGFQRDQRKDIQGPESDEEGPRGSGPPGNEPDPRKTGIGVLDAADEFLQQEQTPQDPNIPTERPVGGFDPENPGARRHHRNPNDDERPPPPLKPPEEEVPIIPGNPNDLGARGARRRSKDDINASPLLRRGLLGV